MRRVIPLILVLAMATAVLVSDAELQDSDTTKPLKPMVRGHGYEIEEHHVKTPDGYFLKMFRIPHKIGEPNTESKKVVFLQHGIIDSADSWVANDEARSVAYILSREGYDVWMGNTRGNKYSHNHEFLDPKYSGDQKQFFNTSFEQMGTIDYPTMIDYVLGVTGQKNLAFIGHSQGTSAMFYALTTEWQDYFKEKVSVFAALGPVARVDHCTSTLLTTFAKQKWAIEIVKKFGVEEIFPANYLQQKIFGLICKTAPIFCDLGISIVADDDPKLLNQKRMGVFMGHYPSGSSFKAVDHYSQIVRAKQFQVYDYGRKMNNEIYGQSKPPRIELENINGMNIGMFVGLSDRLADPVDAQWLRDQIESNVRHYGEYALGHLSFMLAEDMSYFDDVLKLIRDYHG